MKIRLSFIANSSSTSFILEPLDGIGEFFVRNLSGIKKLVSKSNYLKLCNDRLNEDLDRFLDLDYSSLVKNPTFRNLKHVLLFLPLTKLPSPKEEFIDLEKEHNAIVCDFFDSVNNVRSIEDSIPLIDGYLDKIKKFLKKDFSSDDKIRYSCKCDIHFDSKLKDIELFEEKKHIRVIDRITY